MMIRLISLKITKGRNYCWLKLETRALTNFYLESTRKLPIFFGFSDVARCFSSLSGDQYSSSLIVHEREKNARIGRLTWKFSKKSIWWWTKNPHCVSYRWTDAKWHTKSVHIIHTLYHDQDFKRARKTKKKEQIALFKKRFYVYPLE